MRPTGNDDYHAFLDPIDEPVFIIYSPTPESRKLATQRLRFTNSFVPIPKDVFDEDVDFLQRLLVFTLPILVIPKPIFSE